MREALPCLGLLLEHKPWEPLEGELLECDIVMQPCALQQANCWNSYSTCRSVVSSGLKKRNHAACSVRFMHFCFVC